MTGSTDGIGKDFARQLVGKGLNIILVARNDEKLKTTKTQLLETASKGIKIETFVMDFSKACDESLLKLLDFLKGKDVSVLVNNVGVSHDHPEYFTEASVQTMDTIIQVNIVNTLKMTRAILPLFLEKKRGLILNLGSFSGELPVPLLQTYSASKAFLRTWSMALAAELAPHNIQVELLNTYFVVSNMSKLRRPSLMVPTPSAFVKFALRTAGQSPFRTPYPSHAFIYEVMQWIPSWLLATANMAQMRSIRQKALQKAKRTI